MANVNCIALKHFVEIYVSKLNNPMSKCFK